MRPQIKLPRREAETPCLCGPKVEFCGKQMPTSLKVYQTLAGAPHCTGAAQVTVSSGESMGFTGRWFKPVPTREISALYTHVAENTMGWNEDHGTVVGKPTALSLVTGV